MPATPRALMPDSPLSQQLVFDLGHRPAHGLQDFLITASNADAVAHIDRWPDGTAPALILYGPAACGKTHLSAVWCERTNAVRLDAEALSNGDARALFASGDNLLLDPIDPWIGDRTAETTLFHLYNLCREQGHALLLTMRASPARLDFALPDLASRLRACPAVAIAAPDENLLAAVLVKMFADRQLTISAEILHYILPRMERSFAAARDLVIRIDERALRKKRPVSIPLIRELLLG